MKPLLILFLFFKAACSQNRSRTAENMAADSMIKKTDTICFLRTSGTADQDTAYIRMSINGNKVTGDFLYMPYEKDSRKGGIQGTKNDNYIKAVWRFTQEGIQDSLPVEFQRRENKLFQKEYSVNPETGRQFLSDTAGYTLEYKNINCVL